MTKTLVVTVATATQEFPAGTSPAGLRIVLTDVTNKIIGSVELVSGPYVATFSDVVPGDYDIIAQAIDVNGAALGDAITVTETIAPDAPSTVTVTIPVSLSVVVS